MTPTPPPPVRFERAPLQALVADVPLSRLARFQQLMAVEGWAVDLQRMCLDRRYAFDSMALAHTSADDALRSAAVALFADYERAPALH